ncbi:MAG: NUDIX domain-containing protein [Acetobacteraceae bacterium]
MPAAVLVPVILGPLPGILLTKRNAHLNRHGGQVSFPGGRIDADDRDAEAAALREAEEEIALDPSRVEVLGRMADYVTGTGYRITPVLGLLPPGLTLRPPPTRWRRCSNCRSTCCSIPTRRSASATMCAAPGANTGCGRIPTITSGVPPAAAATRPTACVRPPARRPLTAVRELAPLTAKP